MTSPACLVNGASVPAIVAATTSFTIALATIANVTSWTLTCTSTDETITPATVNSTIAINNTTKTATATSQTRGTCMVFRSQVNGGLTNGLADPTLTTTFAVFVPAANGNLVAAVGMTYEAGPNGWIGILNGAARASGGGGGYTPPTGTGFPHVTGGSQDAAARAVNLASSDVTGVLPTANQAQQTIGGTSATGSAAANQILAANSASSSSFATVAGDLACPTIPGYFQVQSLGYGSAIPMSGPGFNFGASVSTPTIGQSSTSASPATSMVWAPQGSTATNGVPGNGTLALAAPNGTGAHAEFQITEGGTLRVSLGAFVGSPVTYDALHLGLQGANPSGSNWCIASNGVGGYTSINNPQLVGICINNGAYVTQWTTSAVKQSQPIIGDGTGSPYGAHGATAAIAVSSNITLTASQYAMQKLNFNCTSASTATFPGYSTSSGYYEKTVYNSGTATLTVASTYGAGTVAVAPGAQVIIGFDTNGATLIGASGGGGSFTAGGDLGGSSTSQVVQSASGASGVFAITAPTIKNQIATNQGTQSGVTSASTSSTTATSTTVFTVPTGFMGRIDVTISARSGTNGGVQTWSGKIINPTGTAAAVKAFAASDSFDNNWSSGSAPTLSVALSGNNVVATVTAASASTVNYVFTTSVASVS